MSNIEVCKNCESPWSKLNKKGYCDRCYPLIKKIQFAEKGERLPGYVSMYFKYEIKDGVIKLYIEALRQRLDLLRDENADQPISAHDLEYRFSKVSMLAVNKRFPKMNDQIAASLEQKERLFVFQLLTKILLLQKPSYESYVHKRAHKLLD